MANQLQLYISEYSVNATIYIILSSNNQEIKAKIKTSQLDKMLPEIVNLEVKHILFLVVPLMYPFKLLNNI